MLVNVFVPSGNKGLTFTIIVIISNYLLLIINPLGFFFALEKYLYKILCTHTNY